MLDDIAAFDKAEAKLAAGEDELVPSVIVDSLLANVNAVKVSRGYRGMSRAYIAQIETDKREGRIDAYTATASALEVTIDNLL